MKLVIKFFQPFSHHFQDTVITLPGTHDFFTFKDFVKHLNGAWPKLYEEICDENGNVQDHVLCVLNGEMLPLEDLMERVLVDGDVISFGYAIGGG